MKTTDFEKKLKQALHQPSVTPDQEHLKQTLFLVRKEISQQQTQKRISFLKFLRLQMKYIGWKIWGVQAIFLLFICGLLTSLYNQYFWESPRSMAKILFCLSVLTVMSALPLLYRTVHYQMQEVEAATYFSSIKLLMAKLAVIGVGNLLLLAGIFIITISKTALQIADASFYLCLPVLFTSSGCMFMLGHLPAKHFFAGSTGFCFLLICIALSIPGESDLLFGQSFSTGRLILCGILLIFCTRQCRYILYHCPYTELQVDF